MISANQCGESVSELENTNDAKFWSHKNASTSNMWISFSWVVLWVSAVMLVAAAKFELTTSAANQTKHLNQICFRWVGEICKRDHLSENEGKCSAESSWKAVSATGSSEPTESSATMSWRGAKGFLLHKFYSVFEKLEYFHMLSQVLGKENEDGAAFELDLTSLRQVLQLFEGVDVTTVRMSMALFEVESKSLV